MSKKTTYKNLDFSKKDLNNICENCNKRHISVSQNLILTSLKICESCKISKFIFPV